MRQMPDRVKGFHKEEQRNPHARQLGNASRPDGDMPAADRARIMYIENKSERLNNRGRIGRVTFSKTGRTLHYAGKTFKSVKGGYKANYYDVETGERYWISGPKKDGTDRLYGTPGVEIDEDVRREYWLEIRRKPERINDRTS